jgi:hypothetical protein
MNFNVEITGTWEPIAEIDDDFQFEFNLLLKNLLIHPN